MKKLLLILCLITTSVSYAQSNLPPCNGNFSGPCFGEREEPSIGHKYVGEWKNDMANGQGTVTTTKGDKLVGQWKDNNLINGQGTQVDGYSGRKYVGQFKNNRYDGFGTNYSADGSIIQQGLFREGKFVQVQTSPTVTPPVISKPRVGSEIVRNCQVRWFGTNFHGIVCDVVTDNLIMKSASYNGGRCQVTGLSTRTYNYGDSVRIDNEYSCRGKMLDFQLDTNQGSFSQQINY